MKVVGKICSKCKKDKDFSVFCRDSSKSDGFYSSCKDCNKEYSRQRSIDKKEENRIYKAKYGALNRTILREKSMEYYKANKQIIFAQSLKKTHSDPVTKLKKRIRSRIYKILKGSCKLNKFIPSIGCTSQELKSYIESKFYNNMTWDNYGEWEIDHIRPLCSFDLLIESEYLEACHYTNLQPLWFSDHMEKGVKYDS